MAKQQLQVIPDEVIMQKIYYIRNQKVMLDSDLAELYGVETKRLKEQVKRNIERFPERYMFELTIEEAEASRSQNATLKRGENIKYLPYAFTEHGVMMLSNVLKSKRAIDVSMRIIDVFIKMREMLSSHKEILQKLDQLMKNDTEQDKKIMLIFEYLKQFEETKQQQLEQANRKRIGFKKGEE
jgi:phage regulator Rha-like protein